VKKQNLSNPAHHPFKAAFPYGKADCAIETAVCGSTQKAPSFMGLLGQHFYACFYLIQFKLSLFFLF